MVSSFAFKLLLVLSVVAVDGYTANFGPCDGACYENVTDTCEEIAKNYDFSTDKCCFTLSDSMDGGCVITAQPTVGNSGCTRVDPRPYCRVGEARGEIGCVAGMYLSYFFQATLSSDGNVSTPALPTLDECPPSDYEVSSSTESDNFFESTMTLAGVSSWTEQDTQDWIQVTADHTEQFFLLSELGYMDINTGIQVYPQGGATLDNTTDEATLVYYQWVSYRGTNVTGEDLLEIAFAQPAGIESYMAKLQASSNPTLAAVTNVTNYEPVAPLEEEDEEQPGGVGAFASTTHESDEVERGGEGSDAATTHEGGPPPEDSLEEEEGDEEEPTPQVVSARDASGAVSSTTTMMMKLSVAVLLLVSSVSASWC